MFFSPAFFNAGSFFSTANMYILKILNKERKIIFYDKYRTMTELISVLRSMDTVSSEIFISKRYGETEL